MKKISTLRAAMLVLLVLSLLSPPMAAASKDKGGAVLEVLYLGNDYVQDPESGAWIDYNHFIIEALESSRSMEVNVEFRWPGEKGYVSTELSFDPYDVVIFSEVWSSHFNEGQIDDLVSFVEDGGGFIMFGGFGGFGGRDEYGEWGGTPIEDILPVEITSNEDAVDEDTEMVYVHKQRDHPLLHGVNLNDAPVLHGYNDVEASGAGTVIAVNSANDAPLLTVGEYGEGRVVAFASNPAGGWGVDFVEWNKYDRFLTNMVSWAANIPERK